MKPDDFEQRLRQEPLRPVPAEWREEILSAAQAAAARPSTLDPHSTPWWRAMLWPCPQAWAGLAAAWLVILTLSFMMRDEPRMVARPDPVPPPTQVQAELKEQRRLLLELAGLREAGNAVRPASPATKPRSERLNPLKAA